MTSSYLLGPDLTDELTRLAAQASLSWPEEFRVLTELGLRDGHAVLDAGCGPGAFTRLLRDALPASPLIALDRDSRLLSHVRGVPRTLAVLGDLANPPVADASQDVVISRFVFQHLPDPVAVAGRIRRVLRPGGLLAVIEVDAGLWGAAVPDMPQGYAAAYQAMAAEQGNGGGDRFIARRLPGLLAAAGYRDVLVRPYAYGGEVDTPAIQAQLGPDRLRPLVERGVVSLAAYAQAHAAWRRFVQCGGRVLLLGFVVSGRAPADESPDHSLTDRLPDIFPGGTVASWHY